MVNDKFLKLKQKYEGLKDYFAYYHKQIIVNYLQTFTKEKYILRYDGAIARLTEVDEKLRYTRIPKLFPIFRAIYSKIVKSNPIFKVEPDRYDPDDETGTDIAEALMTKLYEDIKKYVIPKLAVWFIIAGNWYAKPIYVDKYGKEVDYSEDIGELKIKPICPLNIFYPNNTELTSIEDCPYVFETILLDREFAEKYYKIEPNEGKIDNALKYKILLTGDILDIDRNINTNAYAELVIYTEKKSKYNPDGSYILMSDKRIIEERENPFPDEIGHPYAQGKMNEIGLTIGDTSISYSTTLDREINLAKGQLNEHSKKLANPILSIPDKSLLKQDELGRPDTKIIYTNSNYGEVKYIQPSEFSQYFHINMQKLEEDLNDINAIHDPTKARRPSGIRSALMLAFLAEQDDAQHAPAIDNFFAGLEVLGKKYIKIKSEIFGNIEQDLHILGESNMVYTKFKGEKLKHNSNVKVFVLTGLPTNRIARQQILLELNKYGIVSPSITRKLIGFGELEPVFKMNMRDKVKQYIEIQDIIKGNYVEPKLQDNHIEHINILIQYAKANNFDKLSEDIKNIYWKHATEHISLMLETYNETPLLAHFAMNTTLIDPETKEYIMAEIQKSAMLKQQQAQQNFMQQENVKPQVEQQEQTGNI
ncbi:MAG: hypothetical protein NC918_02750 [Candidatus Omnitrophica bacterium]|nr:hypothetical protein [Candidatus Omnitrophota bacterium]